MCFLYVIVCDKVCWYCFPSAVSRQPSAVSRQPSAVSRQPINLHSMVFVPIYSTYRLWTGNIMNFENLAVWKRSARLSADIYKFTVELTDYGFRNQLTRSSLSVPSNIADKIAGANFERACAASKR